MCLGHTTIGLRPRCLFIWYNRHVQMHVVSVFPLTNDGRPDDNWSGYVRRSCVLSDWTVPRCPYGTIIDHVPTRCGATALAWVKKRHLFHVRDRYHVAIQITNTGFVQLSQACSTIDRSIDRRGWRRSLTHVDGFYSCYGAVWMCAATCERASRGVAAPPAHMFHAVSA